MPTLDELYEQARKAIQKPSHFGSMQTNLMNSLNFEKSIEGAAYWQDVVKRLENYAYVSAGKYTVSHPDVWVYLPPNSSQATQKKNKTLGGPVHVTINGRVGCEDPVLLKERPQDWPEGHSRVYPKEWNTATCTKCRIAGCEWWRLNGPKEEAP